MSFILQFSLIGQEFSQQVQAKQSTLTHMVESVNRLTEGQDSSEHAEIGHLNNTWKELCQQTNQMLNQIEEDLQRMRGYHDCVSDVEVLFDRVSKEWDNLAR